MQDSNAADVPGPRPITGGGGEGEGCRRSVKPTPWALLARLGGTGGGGPAEVDRTQVSPAPARASDALQGLLVVASPQPRLLGAFFPLGADGAALGRGADASARIDDSGISRLHLRITRREGGAFVAEDLGSSNGTYVNGVRVRSAVLAEGDRIQLGTGTELVFGRQTGSGSEEVRLRQALAAAGAGAWEWAAASGVLTLSGGMAREPASGEANTGPRPDFWSRVHEEDRATLRAGLAEALAAGGRCELECRFLQRDGGIGWVALRGEVVRDEAGRGVRITGTALDVTSRKGAEEEMRRQSLLLDSLSDGIVAVDFDGTVLDWNARAEQIFGFTRAEVLRRHLVEVFPSCGDLGADVVARVRAGERDPEERLLRRKDGSDMAAEVAALPLRDRDGRQIACVAVLRDVDERRRMSTQLQVAERLASLGTLAAGVAHEINNPLAFVGSNLQWVRDRLEQMAATLGADWEDLNSALADCAQGAERIRTVVQDLQAHASGNCLSPSVKGPTDPNAAMEFALRVAKNEVRRRARLVCDLRPVPEVKGSQTQIGQVFLNLLLNAAQAIPSGQAQEHELRVRSRYDTASAMALFEVEDTGSGIAPEKLGRIFDPFYSTKPVGSGAGLGLFICHGIVTALRGKIAVESQVGHGSTFRVWLPVAEGRPDTREDRAGNGGSGEEERAGPQG